MNTGIQGERIIEKKFFSRILANTVGRFFAKRKNKPEYRPVGTFLTQLYRSNRRRTRINIENGARSFIESRKLHRSVIKRQTTGSERFLNVKIFLKIHISDASRPIDLVTVFNTPTRE